MEDTRDIRNIRAMKQVLAGKLKDEETYFTYKDISIRTATKKFTMGLRKPDEVIRGYEIVIKDYEHCPFFMIFDYDEYFGYEVWVFEMHNDGTLGENISFVTSKEGHKVGQALIELGYYIGTRF